MRFHLLGITIHYESRGRGRPFLMLHGSQNTLACDLVRDWIERVEVSAPATSRDRSR